MELVLIHVIQVIQRPIHGRGLHHQRHQLGIQVALVDAIVIHRHIQRQHSLLEDFFCGGMANGHLPSKGIVRNHFNNNCREN